MDIQTQLTQIAALALVTVITGVVSWLLAQVRAHVSDVRLRNAIDLFVQGAEQKLEGASGAEKLSWVTGLVGKQFPRARIDPAILRALIEASVRGLDQGLIRGAVVPVPVPGEPVPAPGPEALIQQVLTRVMAALQAGLAGGPPPTA